MKVLLSASQVREIRNLLNRWDPIGVRGEGDGPEDQYDSYLPLIVSLVQGSCSVLDLTDHLDNLRTETMELDADRNADRAIAEAILALASTPE